MPIRRITIADVAAHAGVSTATVSRVLNNTGPVAAETAVRVHTAVRELDYVPHSGARMLAGSRTHTLGLLLPAISDYFFTDVLRGIEQTAYEHGFALLVFTTLNRTDTSQSSIMPLGQHNTDGLIIFTDSLSDEQLHKYHANGFPLVLLHRSAPEGTTIPAVAFQNKEGARQMMAHLLACGYQQIGFLQGPAGNEDAAYREAGYREALAAHRLPVNPVWIKTGNFHAADGATAVAEWLAEGTLPHAIFAADDDSARGALLALQQAGLRVPEDVAVVGFDDSILSQYLTPPLTTVRAPIELAGRTATERLIELINTGHTEPLTLLPTELVIRQSCGCG